MSKLRDDLNRINHLIREIVLDEMDQGNEYTASFYLGSLSNQLSEIVDRIEDEGIDYKDDDGDYNDSIPVIQETPFDIERDQKRIEDENRWEGLIFKSHHRIKEKEDIDIYINEYLEEGHYNQLEFANLNNNTTIAFHLGLQTKEEYVMQIYYQNSRFLNTKIGNLEMFYHTHNNYFIQSANLPYINSNNNIIYLQGCWSHHNSVSFRFTTLNIEEVLIALLDWSKNYDWNDKDEE